MTSLAGTLGGCGTIGKDLYDYINPGNSYLDPSQVGRFDRDNPFGDVRPVKWPILEQLDVVDEPVDRWASATDPTPADLVAQNKEYTLGPGDILRISVYELVQPNTEYLKEQAQVSESGTVSLQNLGAVQVAGLTAREAEEKIGQIAVERNLLLPKGNGSQGPQVSVTLEQSQSRIFTILGNVQQPSTYNIIGSDFRLLSALGLARDIAGGSQPGLDYLYVIRRTGPKPGLATDSSLPTTPDVGTPMPTATPTPTGNPLDALDSLDKPTTAPSLSPMTEPGAVTPPPATLPTPPTEPSTTPATGPGTTGPMFVRPLPTAMVASAGETGSTQLAQADLDAAISGTPASQPGMTTVNPATPAATAPADELLNQAMGSTTKPGQNVYVDGKWQTLPQTMPGATTAPGTADTGALAAQAPAAPATMARPVTPLPAAPTPNSGTDFAAAEALSGQRVIRISVNGLREGNPKYNIVIQPGDTIVVPGVEQGFFYMMGHVGRPGVYTLTGQKITLKMAVAAAGNLDAIAIPRRCDLIRRIGPNQEVTVQVNLQAVFDGTQPDIFLKPNDLVNIGTDLVAPFLAVVRNGYRASYGFGFIYDRNYYIQPTKVE
jgi:protein involved in polysaccharide export with SLBB domain